LVKDIGEALYLDSGTMTPLLKRLEMAELIVRTRGEEDERQVRITLTASGKRLKMAAKEIPPQILRASGQNKDALDSLRKQLMQLRDDLGD
jgi:DNA-binding MarR family transcriptional regulator